VRTRTQAILQPDFERGRARLQHRPQQVTPRAPSGSGQEAPVARFVARRPLSASLASILVEGRVDRWAANRRPGRISEIWSGMRLARNGVVRAGFGFLLRAWRLALERLLARVISGR
jgi:hypothetical protein